MARASKMIYFALSLALALRHKVESLFHEQKENATSCREATRRGSRAVTAALG